MKKKSLNHFYDCTSLARHPPRALHLLSYLFYNAALLLFSTSPQSRTPREDHSERDLWQWPSLPSNILATQHKALMRLQPIPPVSSRVFELFYIVFVPIKFRKIVFKWHEGFDTAFQIQSLSKLDSTADSSSLSTYHSFERVGCNRERKCWLSLQFFQRWCAFLQPGYVILVNKQGWLGVIS